jgi:hypothetical protein
MVLRFITPRKELKDQINLYIDLIQNNKVLDKCFIIKILFDAQTGIFILRNTIF